MMYMFTHPTFDVSGNKLASDALDTSMIVAACTCFLTLQDDFHDIPMEERITEKK